MKMKPNSELAVDLLDMVVLIHNKIRNEVWCVCGKFEWLEDDSGQPRASDGIPQPSHAANDLEVPNYQFTPPECTPLHRVHSPVYMTQLCKVMVGWSTHGEYTLCRGGVLRKINE